MTIDRATPESQASAAVRERLATLEPLASLLPAIQQAAEAHPGVYIVGGGVRDLLLGAETTDLDLAIEGDALGFARDLSVLLGGAAREHEHFGTAVVTIEVGKSRMTIDVAGTRRETYSQPGALPEVAPAGLGADLARRDFTINAMASSLKRDDFGETCDPFGGYRDLLDRRLRVLHEASFSDDPTRLLRAARYASRFAFEIEPQTLTLARVAAGGGLLGTMDSARVRDELVDLLSEREVATALELAHGLGLDRALHARLVADSQAIERIARVREPLARLALLCTQMSDRELGSWLDRLQFTAEQRQTVVVAARDGLALGLTLDALQAPAPSELAALLAGKPEEALAIAASQSDRATELVDRYRDRIAPVALEITGDDLLAAGVEQGPRVGLALREALALKLDGFVNGRDEELTAALRSAETAGQ